MHSPDEIVVEPDFPVLIPQYAQDDPQLVNSTLHGLNTIPSDLQRIPRTIRAAMAVRNEAHTVRAIARMAPTISISYIASSHC